MYKSREGGKMGSYNYDLDGGKMLILGYTVIFNPPTHIS